MDDYREVEIEAISPLSARDEALVDHHSLLNVLNILHGELVILGYRFGNRAGLLARSLSACEEFIGALESPAKGLGVAGETDRHAEHILAEIAARQAEHPELRNDSGVLDSVRNIRSVLGIWSVRAQEILARARQPMRWEWLETAALSSSFQEVLRVIAANSRGRFGIVYDPRGRTARDYLVRLTFRTAGGSRMHMPPVLVDVMRDLIANARKYTAPGGEIVADLHENDQWLEFTVQDTGRGIPPAELTEVVEFGRRGSNVADVRSMGGGFGLTKAFLVTKRFGGRFWMASRLGQGTRVRLVLPRPVVEEDDVRQAARADTGRRSSILHVDPLRPAGLT